MSASEAVVFETGSNEWRRYETWPPATGLSERRLYLGARRSLSFNAPADASGYDEYVSDPENPVPYRPRPVTPTYPGPEWPEWLVQDQRFVDHRPDVLSWQTEPLAAHIRIAGDLKAELFASTSGSDSDWVVKFMDVIRRKPPGRAE